MLGLVAVLWAVYLSECLVRWKPGDWIFRRTLSGGVRGVNAPDVTFWNERFALVWVSPWPALDVFRFSGEHLDSRACRARLDLHARRTRWLRASARTLFLLLLVLLPTLALAERVLPWILPLAAAVLLAWLSALVAFGRAYRSVHGRSPAPEMWLMNALSPVS